MATGESRVQRFGALERRPRKDFDPEAEHEPRDDDKSSSQESEDDLAGTEHYVAVGKSKLRRKEAEPLGPQYSGTRISRAALEAGSGDSDDQRDGFEDDEEDADSENYDDPDTADLEADHIDEDEEIDSDEAFGPSDEERYKGYTFRGSSKPANGTESRRPVAADFLSPEDESPSLDGGEGSDSGEDEDFDDRESGDTDGELDMRPSRARQTGRLTLGEGEDDDNSDDAEEESDENLDTDASEADEADAATQAQLRKLLSDDRRTVMAPMSQSAKAEVEKGLAVRQQRRSFDSLLNIRIRLQKALVAVNSLNTVSGDAGQGMEAYQASEEAALRLCKTIDSFRDSVLLSSSAKAGEKRKRIDFELDSSSESIWEAMEETEGHAGPIRRQILDKWSAKVQRPTATTGRKLISAPSQSLVSVLDDQLVSADRLISRTRKPRSCAPVQAANKVEEDAEVYDDADFYQLLLKELVDQRSTDSSAPGSSVTTVKWAAVKEAKTRKHVDRKASKGRKLRFNVHEKLQNFMAPEDRTAWEQAAVDRFFGTLFGQKMELREDDSDEDMDGGANAEEEGLRLFRS